MSKSKESIKTQKKDNPKNRKLDIIREKESKKELLTNETEDEEC